MSYEEDEDYTYDDSEGDVEMTQEEDDEQGKYSPLFAHWLLTSSIIADIVDDAIDFDVVAEKDRPKSYDIEYTTLSTAQVEQTMDADIERIVSMLGLEVSVTPTPNHDLSSFPQLPCHCSAC